MPGRESGCIDWVRMRSDCVTALLHSSFSNPVSINRGHPSLAHVLKINTEQIESVKRTAWRWYSSHKAAINTPVLCTV